jgi:protein-S-isoprenylcysteine O-methyltransferase Ste14
MLFARALLAFLILPGLFAGLLPRWIVLADGARGEGWAIGWVVAGMGAAVILWCVRDFYRAGKGTLAPWDPPRQLVVVGLYRYTRNPMYVGVLTLVLGWCLIFGSPLLAAYAVVLAIGFHLRVILYEEPRLAAQFGEQFSRYRNAVPRWLPRRSRWRDAAAPG